MTKWLLTGRHWVWGYVALTLAGLAAGIMLQRFAVAPDLTHVTVVVLVWVAVLNVLPILLFSMAGIRERRPVRPAGQAASHPVRFLVIIAAYNEERVIRNSVGSLLAQQRQHSLARVVVAFNGNDDTGRIAADMGAEVITTPTVGCGKAQAISYALSRIPAEPGRYVLILDADNLVEPDFLDAMAVHAASGEIALQGNHQALLASENWISVGLQTGYAASSRLFNPGRCRLLRSALICGTGFAVREDAFRTLWPLVRTQTEDIELNGLLALHYDSGVRWVETARFYDEKPDTIVIAIRQRVRWMVGHLHCLWRYAGPLLMNGLRRRDIRSVELASYYAVPSALLAASVWLTIVVPASFVGGYRAVAFDEWWALAGSGLILAYVIGLPMLGQLLQQRASVCAHSLASALRASVYSAFFALCVWPMAIILASALLPRRDWIFHTPHRARRVDS